MRVWNKLIHNGTGDTTVYQATHLMEDMSLVVDYVGDGVDSAATMTVYSSNDQYGTVKTAIGIMPVLTGVRDADGAISFGTGNTTVAYEIPGRHQFIFISITSTTDVVGINMWLGGTEYL